MLWERSSYDQLHLSVGTSDDLASVCDFSEVNISSLLTPHSSLLTPYFSLLTPFPIMANSGFKDAEVRHAVPRLGDVKRNYSDTSKAQRLLGWRAEVELAEGLARTVEWFTNL